MPRGRSRRKVTGLVPSSSREKRCGAAAQELKKSLEESSGDRMWFYNNLDKLRKKYLNKYVAVRRRRVVMSDSDHDRLLTRLKDSEEGRARAKIFLVEPEGTIWIL